LRRIEARWPKITDHWLTKTPQGRILGKHKFQSPTMLFEPVPALLLPAPAILAYYQTQENNFVNWNNNVYITEKPDLKTRRNFSPTSRNNTCEALTMPAKDI
jgi:hypothetical protein